MTEQTRPGGGRPLHANDLLGDSQATRNQTHK